MSLRWKIVLLIITSVVIAALTCGVVVRQSAAVIETNRQRDNVTAQLRDAISVYADTGVLTLNTSIDDEDLPEEAHRAALDGQSVTTMSTVDGEDVLWAAAPVEVGTHSAVISVRQSTRESEALLDGIDRAVLLGMLGSALVVGGIGSVAAGQISRRLTLGAQSARRIADGDTSVRVSEVIDYGADEVADFARAVDSAVSRLTERIDSEQRFTADLAHEMRTPLTGLVNAANLLEEDSRPAELVRERVARLQVLVEDLLEVSRLDAGRAQPQLEPMPVDASLRSLTGVLEASGALAGQAVELDLGAGEATVMTDQRRFERIVTNLLVNAVKHGAGPIRLTSKPETVVVSDSGPGYPPDILATGPTRFVSAGGGGMGLGLVIAQGQARLLSMSLEFRNGADGGAETTIRFPQQG
ncbi:sensor histidine kinase [Brevibacterium album]|uniref:sensor histidine kinase n=1 Tax=Brevibacterium album TaxID=417948 RepID=UPI00041DCF4D|nr:HAMP domain-containing sensor histidine kinase [Brevibacterium album]